MKAQISLGRFNGIPVSIHWTFLLLVAWIIVINSLSVWQTQGLVWSILLLVALFVSVFGHELGHAIMARFCGARISGMILLPTGVVNSYRAMPKKRAQVFLMLIGGPLVNLLIAALLSFFVDPFQAYWNAPESIGNVSHSNFLFQWQIINLSFFFLNLIPAFPLDGGGMLRNLLTYKMEKNKATHVVLIVSQVIGYAFVVSGIIWINLLFILLGTYILFTCGINEYKEPLKTNGKTLSFNHDAAL